MQSTRSYNELFRRGQTVANNSAVVQQAEPFDAPGETPAAPAVGDQHPLRGAWIAGSLFM